MRNGAETLLVNEAAELGGREIAEFIADHAHMPSKVEKLRGLIALLREGRKLEMARHQKGLLLVDGYSTPWWVLG